VIFSEEAGKWNTGTKHQPWREQRNSAFLFHCFLKVNFKINGTRFYSIG
jgi:hypothetical protein